MRSAFVSVFSFQHLTYNGQRSLCNRRAPGGRQVRQMMYMHPGGGPLVASGAAKQSQIAPVLFRPACCAPPMS
jgi:hypothetical protein